MSTITQPLCETRLPESNVFRSFYGNQSYYSKRNDSEESTSSSGESPSSTEESPSSTEESPSSTRESLSSSRESLSSTRESLSFTGESLSFSGERPSFTEESPSSTEESPSSTRESPSSTRGSPSSTKGNPSSTEENPSLIEASTSSAEASTSSAEASTSSAEKGTPPAENDTPPAENDTPPAENDTPPAGKSTSSAEKSTSSAEKSTSSAEKGTSPAEKSTFSAEKGTPSAEENLEFSKMSLFVEESSPSSQDNSSPLQTSFLPSRESSLTSRTSSLSSPERIFSALESPLPSPPRSLSSGTSSSSSRESVLSGLESPLPSPTRPMSSREISSSSRDRSSLLRRRIWRSRVNSSEESNSYDFSESSTDEEIPRLLIKIRSNKRMTRESSSVMRNLDPETKSSHASSRSGISLCGNSFPAKAPNFSESQLMNSQELFFEGDSDKCIACAAPLKETPSQYNSLISLLKMCLGCSLGLFYETLMSFGSLKNVSLGSKPEISEQQIISFFQELLLQVLPSETTKSKETNYNLATQEGSESSFEAALLWESLRNKASSIASRSSPRLPIVEINSKSIDSKQFFDDGSDLVEVDNPGAKFASREVPSSPNLCRSSSDASEDDVEFRQKIQTKPKEQSKLTPNDNELADDETLTVEIREKRLSTLPLQRVPSNYHIPPLMEIMPSAYSPVIPSKPKPVTVFEPVYEPHTPKRDPVRLRSAPVFSFEQNTPEHFSSALQIDKAVTDDSLNSTKNYARAPNTFPLRRKQPVNHAPQNPRIAIHQDNYAPNLVFYQPASTENLSDCSDHSDISFLTSSSKLNDANYTLTPNASPLQREQLVNRVPENPRIVIHQDDKLNSVSSQLTPLKNLPNSPDRKHNFSLSNFILDHAEQEVGPTNKSRKEKAICIDFDATEAYSYAVRYRGNHLTAHSEPIWSFSEKVKEIHESPSLEQIDKAKPKKSLKSTLKLTKEFFQKTLDTKLPKPQFLQKWTESPKNREVFQDCSVSKTTEENASETKLPSAVNKTGVYEGDEGERDIEYVPENGAQASDSFSYKSPLKLEESMLRLHQELKSGELVAKFETRYRINPNLPMDIARWSCNETRNRYRDISPYDKTRVVLRDDGSESPFNDYINASFVDMEITGTKIVNKYIASQGPLSTTCGHFWLMVWQQHCLLLVMLTTCVEQGRTKCRQYWPEVNCSADYGAISVRCDDEQKTKSGFIWRQFTVKHKSSEEKRKIQHLQYVTWPDHGVPEHSNDFLTFVQEVRRIRAEDRENQYPVLVHCSAGIGRTGVLILMETSQCLIEANQPLFPENLVMKMRDQRPMMIQTSGQFRFVCEAIHRVYDEKLIRPLELDSSR